VPERLTGKTALVTGASRGIGLEITRSLVAEGARVAMVARTLATLESESRALGDRAMAVRCDISRADDTAVAVSRISTLFPGSPDIVVNNAGTFTLGPIEAIDPEAFEAELETNLVAPLRLIRAFLPAMRERRSGDIVTIGSVADRAVLAGNAAYAPSKVAARALHEVLRLETRGSGVRAMLVSPGPVDTAMWDPIDPDRHEGFTPRSQMLTARSVAEAVMFAVTQPRSVNIDELRLSRA
jgi:NADP-dependent 3-hydroxy acid dehydrogenase YdfG